MCGIAGIVRFDGQSVEKSLIEAMTDVIAHRGPDGEGQWLAGPVGLGHRRLSIIDLSRQANQPMVSEDDQAIIVFNGEIYNYCDLKDVVRAKGYVCRTNSDTEIILHMYRLFGPDCVSHFRGMFAFAIWDRREEQLFVARDRVGIKPLYFLKSNDEFVFASEIKAIAASGHSRLQVDRKAVAGLMRFLVVPHPETIFDDILKLEPGRTLLVRLDGTVREKIYWQPLTGAGIDDSRNESEWVSDLDGLLNESIRYHMVSDVPVAAFLSGGLDSSSVVALMRKQAPEMQFESFSITFPAQAEYDEGVYARRVAAQAGICNHAESISESFMDDASSIAWHLDEPFGEHSAFATYYLARNAARRVKVVLTGDGGDELFAGYTGYTDDRYLEKVRFSRTLAVFSSFLVKVMGSRRVSDQRFLRLLTGITRRLGSEGLRYSERAAQNSLHACSVAFSPDYFYSGISEWKNNLMADYYDSLQTEDRLLRKLFCEYKTRLIDEMLMKVDRMTMAHSLEARVPLLDHKIVEFAFKVPSRFKLARNNGAPTTKYLLKKTMENHLPHEIIYRKKQGFNIPVKIWMTGDYINRVTAILLDGRLRDAGVLNVKGIAKILDDQKNNRYDYTNVLMLLLSMESWAGVYEDRFGAVSWS